MKRKFTCLIAAVVMLLTMMAFPTGMRGQNNVTFTAGVDTGETSVTKDGITVSMSTMSRTDNYRCYANTAMTITSTAGNITHVEFTCTGSGTSNYGPGKFSLTEGYDGDYSYSGTTGIWSGNSEEISLTASAQVRITEIVVTYGGAPAPTTYTVFYDCNGGTSGCPDNLTGVEPGTVINLAIAPTLENYNFSGWNDGTTTYDEGDQYTVNSNVTFTAQWTSSGDEQWVLTNLADLTEDDVFVMVGNNGSNYAITNDNGTGSAPATLAVTITGNEITSTVTANIQWTVSGDATNGYSFSPNGSTDSWLYCNTNAATSSNNNIRVGNGGQYNRIVFELNSNNFLVTKDSYVNRYLSIYNNADWRGYINTNQCPAMSFYKKITGGVVPPSISAENVNIEYNAEGGSISYTINNEVPGGTVNAEVTNGDWLTLGQNTNSPIAFTCSANEAGTERTATVTLTYTYNRASVTKNVTVTQAGNPDATMSIAEVRAQGSGSVVTKGIVTSCVETTGYIQDATAAICVYGTSLTVGDEIRVSGSLTTYNGLLEITNPQVTVLSSNNPILPQLMTIAEVVASTNQGWYVRIEEATVTEINGQNTTIAQGDNTIVVRGISGVEYSTGDILSLNGNIGSFNGNQIANPQNVEVQHPTVPTITITNTTINVPFEGEVGTIAVTYTNFEDIEPTAQFFAEDGETPATYGWVTITFDQENNAVYSINPNEGDARTAYFKVYEESEGIYSNLVTIIQSEYVAPTYAELPFTFDGGRDDIEGTDGLYQEGLGSDYNNSPKLRFDHTGDWLLLQFSERPGKLSFKIKGNTFSEGTFTVQASEDGETYTVLASYTELGATQDEEFNNLGENVRFIKWIYTEKVNGNVALGAITLEEYAEPVASIIVTPDVVNEDAAEHDGTLDLTYENITITSMDEFGIQYYDAEGEETEEPEWVEVLVAEQDPEIGEGYVVSYYMIDNDGEARSAYFKVFAVGTEDFVYSNLVTINQAAYIPPFEPATYKLASSIESGKAYIITSDVYYGDNDDYVVYAMGTQNNNNRAAVSVGINDATITVDTDNVYEFVIEGPDEGGLYTIYDARTPGYLYAASSSSNWLRTQAENDDNGRWAITFNAEGGYAEIQATESSNRNVMQYNGGSSLFSCYSSASQSPVYLYVKDETPSVITQTIELISGWNWVSIGIAVEDPVEMLDQLKASLGDNAIQIQSIDYTTEYEGDGEWFGDLDDEGVFNEQMYLIEATNDCTVELTGMPAVADEYEITIYPGWNWIGFPSAVAIDVIDAMADFEAAEGDEIQDIDYTTEFDGEDWFGDLETFEPGKGLLYNNTTDETKILIFSTGAKKVRNAKPVLGTFKAVPVKAKVMGPCKSIADPINKDQAKKH